MNNYYATVKILRVDHKRLRVLAAQRDEKLIECFSAALNLMEKGFQTDWKVEAKKLYLDDGNKIAAIKYCVKQTGLSLGSAARAVESLAVKL